jgi:hypothetical protein
MSARVFQTYSVPSCVRTGYADAMQMQAAQKLEFVLKMFIFWNVTRNGPLKINRRFGVCCLSTNYTTSSQPPMSE